MRDGAQAGVNQITAVIGGPGKGCWMTIVPTGPFARCTLREVARRDPDYLCFLAARGPTPELRTAAAAVRGWLTLAPVAMEGH